MTDETVQSPSEKLSRRIVDRLEREGLLSSEQAEKLLVRLVAGNATQEDWRFAIELSMQRRADGRT